MRTLRLLVALLLVAVLVFSASAQEDDTIPPILEILSLVPHTARTEIIGYSDMRAAEQARPGAAQPETFRAFQRLSEEDDPSARMWLGAFPGSGFSPINYLLTAGEILPEVMGFDLLDIDRAVTFGYPPAHADIFMGDFDEAAIDAVLTRQGFVRDELNGLPIWCGEAGCVEGASTNFKNRNPANLFGGELGRQQPTVLTGDFLFSSPNFGIVESMVERVTGEDRSIADLPEYQLAVRAMTENPVTLLRQAYFIDPNQINPFPLSSNAVITMFETADLGEMPEDFAEAVAALEERYGELPSYRLLAFADYADTDHQYASIIMVYQDAADAQTALELIPQRIEIAPSLATDRPVSELFEDRGAELTSTLLEDDDTGLSAAVFVWRYDHPSTEPDDSGLYRTPGLVFRMFQQMVFSSDIAWLTYDFE